MKPYVNKKKWRLSVGFEVSLTSLGAPLTVIDNRAKKLLRHTDSEDDRRQLQAIRGQVHRLTRLVNQLLAFSRTPGANANKWQ